MILGLIVNPIAGIGGRVGLKGSDGLEIQRRALALGAQPQANRRAAEALAALAPHKEAFELVTAAGEMGETAARQAGFAPRVIGQAVQATHADHTIRAAQEMLRLPVDLLLFAGGDGTARDIYAAVGASLPVLGIPAGVKIYSAVFATHPRAAGEIAAEVVQGGRVRTREAEVVDLDEEAYRAGAVATRLYSYLRVPYLARRMQNKKAPSPAGEAARLDAIAADVIESMKPGWLYILGPGTTTRAIAERMGLPKTLVGVDVYRQDAVDARDGVVALDASEDRLMQLLQGQPAAIVVTPIGGQGFLFGRGNQQIGPRVIQQVGRDHLVVVSLAEKMLALNGQPFLVDTGDPAVDALLAGYLPVTVGYREKVMYRVAGF